MTECLMLHFTTSEGKINRLLFHVLRPTIFYCDCSIFSNKENIQFDIDTKEGVENVEK